MKEILTMTKYTITDKKSPDGSNILRFDEGEFEGLEFYYGNVSFHEEEEENEEYCKMSFDYEVIVPDDREIDKESVELKTTIGNILVSVIKEYVALQESSSINE